MTPPRRDLHQPENHTGSPSNGEPVFLVIGKLRKPHGLRGELLMEVLTDFPERFRPGMRVYVGSSYRPMLINNLRWHRSALLITFRGYNTRDQVDDLRNQMVHVHAKDIHPLPEGEFYRHQILGMRVFSDSGEQLGTVTDILETGANDVCVVRPESGPEILLPVIESVILDIDMAMDKMVVHLLPGLIPE